MSRPDFDPGQMKFNEAETGGGTLLENGYGMSALGQKQTFAMQKGMSALPPKAIEKADIAVSMEGRAFLLCPVLQTSTCSAMARASSTSIPRYRTVLSILV